MSISGKKLGATVGGTNVDGTYEFDITGKVDVLDRTTGTDNGYGNVDGGVRDKTGSATIYVDILDGIGVTIDEGDVLESVVFWLDLDGVVGQSFPSILVTECTLRGVVRDKLTYAIRFQTKGEYTNFFAS